MNVWVLIAACVAATVTIKAAGPVLLGGRELPAGHAPGHRVPGPGPAVRPRRHRGASRTAGSSTSAPRPSG